MPQSQVILTSRRSTAVHTHLQGLGGFLKGRYCHCWGNTDKAGKRKMGYAEGKQEWGNRTAYRTTGHQLRILQLALRRYFY